jgi:hypothetical protein
VLKKAPNQVLNQKLIQKLNQALEQSNRLPEPGHGA